jgi:hypothetical protein
MTLIKAEKQEIKVSYLEGSIILDFRFKKTALKSKLTKI